MLVTDTSILQPDPSRNQDLSSYNSSVELTVNIQRSQAHHFIQALKDFLTVLPILFQLKLKLSGGGYINGQSLGLKRSFTSQ